MRTISLRKFRDSIPEVGEAIQVSRRDSDGNYQILGVWQPSVVSVGTDPLELVRKDTGGVFPDGTTNTPSPDFTRRPELTTVSRFNSRGSRPVPKK